MDRSDGDIAALDRLQQPEQRAERPQDRPTAEPPAPVRPRRRGFGWLVVLLVLAGLGWAGWHYLWPRIQAARAGGAAQGRRAGTGAPQPVGVAKIGTGDLNVVLTGIGTVTPLATVTVQTQISGQLLEVGFQEGQMVKKGDFLAQIDPRPYQATLEQAQGAFAHDTGLLNQAKSDLDRYNTLNRQDSIAKQTYADQQFVVQQDEGLLKEDQASIDTANLNLAYCHIVSPVSGRVGLRLVDPGNYVQASSATGLAVVTQLDPISVIFVLPEDEVSEVMKQQRAGQPLSVTAYDRTDTKLLATGTLTTVDNTVDTTTGTVKFRATFANADAALFPNQFVNARLLLRVVRGAVRVPVAAVQRGAPGTFVYLVKPDETVSVAPIKTGITDGDVTEVTDGLKPGDEVVVDGTDRLREGAKVRVTADAADPQATPGTAPAARSGGDTPGRAQAGEGAQASDSAKDQTPPADATLNGGQGRPQGEHRRRRRDQSHGGDAGSSGEAAGQAPPP